MSQRSKQTDPSAVYQQSKNASPVSPASLDEQLLSAARAQASTNAENYKAAKQTGNRSPWVPAIAFACVCLVGITFVLRTGTPDFSSDNFSNDEKVVDEFSVRQEAQIAALDSEQAASRQRLSAPVPAPATAYEPAQFEPAPQIQEIVITGRKRVQSLEETSVTVTVLADSGFQVIDEAPQAISGLQEQQIEEGSLPNRIQSDTFVLQDISTFIPNIVIDMAYAGSENFIGEPVDGYLFAKALLTPEAVNALSLVQQDANELGMGLKIFDAYRPQRAVDHFLHWANQPDDEQLKAKYYPDIDKTELFQQGYLVEQSSHSRGSTVDLTLINLEDGQELDMGTGFDFFDPTSWALSRAVPEQAQENRRLLRSLMLNRGFEPFEAEWWHFTLRDEPYPDQYFDVPID